MKERGILYAPDFVIGGAELFQTEPELWPTPRASGCARRPSGSTT